MRRNITFWLNERREADSDLLTYIRELKKAREFSSAIRDGLRLIRDLRAGNLDVLFELFPWIERALYDALKESQDDSGGSNVLLEKLERMERKLSELQQPGAHYQRPALSAPRNDDDLLASLEIQQASSSGVDAGQNLINSLLAMAGEKPPPSGPKKMDAPAVLPVPDFDDLESMFSQ